MHFLAFPTELQSLILSFCPPATLLTCLTTSHTLHSLALPPLYARVTIHSWAHLTSFFLPSTAQDTDRRHKELTTHLKELRLDFPSEYAKTGLPNPNGYRDVFPTTRKKPFGPLPRAFRSEPIKLDTLRLSIWGDNGWAILLPLLQVLDPRTVHLFSPKPYSKLLHGPLAAIINKSWKRVETLEVVAVDSSPFARPKKLGVLGRTLKSFRVVLLPGAPTSRYTELLAEDALAMVGGGKWAEEMMIVVEEETQAMVNRLVAGNEGVVVKRVERDSERPITEIRGGLEEWTVWPGEERMGEEV